MIKHSKDRRPTKGDVSGRRESCTPQTDTDTNPRPKWTLDTPISPHPLLLLLLLRLGFLLCFFPPFFSDNFDQVSAKCIIPMYKHGPMENYCLINQVLHWLRKPRAYI